LDLLLQPRGERLLHGFNVAGEEVISAGYEDELFRIRGCVYDLLEFGLRSELVAVAAEEELGCFAAEEEGISIVSANALGGKAERAQSADIGAM